MGCTLSMAPRPSNRREKAPPTEVSKRPAFAYRGTAKAAFRAAASGTLEDEQHLMSQSTASGSRRSDAASDTASSKGPQNFHDNYVLLDKLGSGAFASVYAATCLEAPNVEQAVKVTDLRLVKNNQRLEGTWDPKRCLDVEREVEMLRRVSDHTHVLQCHGLFFEHSFSYVILEKCDRSLLDVIEKQPVNESTLKPIIFQMLKALETVHAAGIVHRDVKPDNFLCTTPGNTVKLCDFGFACIASREGSDVGVQGIYGTPPFMAPEMLKEPFYGTAVDVWAVGVILYTLLFGQFPYMPKVRTSAAMKTAIMRNSPAPTWRAARSCPETFPSGEVLSLLRSRLLVRQQLVRASASQALRDPFFKISSSTAMVKDNLRPMLRCSKHLGLFDARSAHKGALTAVDQKLVTLQCESRSRQRAAKEQQRRQRQEKEEAAGNKGDSESDGSSSARLSNVSTATPGTATATPATTATGDSSCLTGINSNSNSNSSNNTSKKAVTTGCADTGVFYERTGFTV